MCGKPACRQAGLSGLSTIRHNPRLIGLKTKELASYRERRTDSLQVSGLYTNVYGT